MNNPLAFAVTNRILYGINSNMNGNIHLEMIVDGDRKVVVHRIKNIKDYDLAETYQISKDGKVVMIPPEKFLEEIYGEESTNFKTARDSRNAIISALAECKYICTDDRGVQSGKRVCIYRKG